MNKLTTHKSVSALQKAHKLLLEAQELLILAQQGTNTTMKEEVGDLLSGLKEVKEQVGYLTEQKQDF